MAKVKICGLTNIDDARKAEELGAEYVGFVLFNKSPRMIRPSDAAAIAKALKGTAKKVGLFLDEIIDAVVKAVDTAGLDAVQLHGDEGPDYVNALIEKLRKRVTVIKSFKIKKGFSFDILQRYPMADFFLFDTFKEGMPGGTGQTFDWEIIRGRDFPKPIFLAGGLNPDNVRTAIGTVKPYAVDIASGIERSPGKKDHTLMEAFINAAR
ncbi:MAG: phosphoribosylanthranilate isomerase [Candidatus Omnitrophica bacterium]|nr:phosphoribosylanthranilate isomerase [Candidatus Omnitrophota bacterium]